MAPMQGSRRVVDGAEDDRVQPEDELGEGSLDLASEDNEADSQDGDSLSGDDEENVGSEDGSEASEGEEEVERKVQSVSFGALKQAHDALSRKRKRGSDTTADQDEKLDALRARLQEIRSKSNANTKSQKSDRVKGERHTDKSVSKFKDVEDADDHSEVDSDSAPSEEKGNTKSRSSKHAPASQSSKHQVTRKRTVVDVPKRTFRDPRFDALQQQSEHAGNSAKAYSFLWDYQKDEIAELKSAIKQARNEEDKETLRRKMVSMQNRIKSQEAKEREQEILKQHRREEKEKVEQGKQPFYLKRKDVKERAIVEKFKGMKGKDREKLIEKRRRKESQKEKRRMPDARRLNA